MSKTVAIIEKVRQLQEERGINEVKFSEMLGISRAHWWMMKKGDRKPSAAFLSAVMRAFPELEGEVIDYMKSLHGEESEKVETLEVG
jgi:transcriptional regulator with XRE-family HTH domain